MTLLDYWKDVLKLKRQNCCLLLSDGFDTKSFTFDDVNNVSVKIQQFLQKHGYHKEVIGLDEMLQENNLPCIIGVLYVDSAFYTIPDTCSQPGLIDIIERIRFRVVLCSKGKAHALMTMATDFDTYIEDIEGTNIIAVHLKSVKYCKLKQMIAYVITTSGTTGQPKIVWVPHSCVMPNINCFRDIFSVIEKDIIFQCSPLTFDPSIVEIFVSVSAGATLLTVTKNVKSNTSLLGNILAQHKVTVMQATPTLMSLFNKEFLQSTLLSKNTSLRVLALGGENCPNTNVLRSWKAPGNQTQFFNVYGITEVSSWATWHCITEEEMIEDTEVPLGVPINETKLKILKSDGKEYNDGFLHIGGNRVCLINTESELIPEMYRNSGDLVHIDKKGNIFYKGRVDDQIKRHGKRINLQQIEKVYEEYHAPSQCCVVFDKDHQIVYLFVREYLRCESSKVLTCSDIEITLKEYLPKYSLPDRILFVPHFPITHHGKIDKSALLSQILSQRSLSSSEEFKESRFWDIIQDVLGTNMEYNSNQCLMEVGGDSLKAIQIIKQLEDCYDVTLKQNIWDIVTQKSFSRVIATLKDTVNAQLINKAFNEEKSVTSFRRDEIYSDIQMSLPHKRQKIDFIVTKLLSVELPFLSKFNEGYYDWYTLERCGKVFISFKEECDPDMKIKSPSTSSGTIDDQTNDIIKDDKIFSCKDENDQNLVDSQYERELIVSLRWKYDLGKCIDASPLVVVKDSNRKYVIIGSHSHHVTCVDIDTGMPLWDVLLGDRVESSACISASGKYVVIGCYDGYVYTLDIKNGSTFWMFKTNNQVKCSPCLDPINGAIYIGSHDKNLYALNVEEKLCIWSCSLGGGSVFSSPAVCLDPHSVVAATLSGKIVALSPDNGDYIWCIEVGKPLFSSPTIYGNNIYIGCVDNNIYCFTLQGEKVWTFKTSGPVFSSAFILPSTSVLEQFSCKSNDKKQTVNLVIGSHDNCVYCINKSGILQWKFKTNSAVYSSPFIMTIQRESGCKERQNVDFTTSLKVVIVSSTKGQLYILNVETGELIKEYNLPGEVFSSVVVIDKNIVVGCRDDYLYCLKIT